MAQIPDHLFEELDRLLDRLERTPQQPGAVVSFLEAHASDVMPSLSTTVTLLFMSKAASAGQPDVLLRIVALAPKSVEGAGARVSAFDLFSDVLENTTVYDLNGDKLDDAGIARRLRVMYEMYGLRVPLTGGFRVHPGSMSRGTYD